MQAYEEILEGPVILCHDCASWLDGVLETWTKININFDGDVEDFDIHSHEWERYEYYQDPGCGCDYEMPGEDCFTQFYKGDSVWVCGNCDSWFTDQDEAINCCQEG